MQKNCPLFEIPASILPGKMVMARPCRQLALTEISSLNLAPFHLLDPVEKSINDYQRKDKTWSIQVQPFKI